MIDGDPFTSKIDSNHTFYHVLNAETANPVNWYLISGEGDCGEGDCGEVDCGEADCGEGEWIPDKSCHLNLGTQIHYSSSLSRDPLDYVRLVINTTLGYGITASGEIGTLWE